MRIRMTLESSQKRNERTPTCKCGFAAAQNPQRQSLLITGMKLNCRLQNHPRTTSTQVFRNWRVYTNNCKQSNDTTLKSSYDESIWHFYRHRLSTHHGFAKSRIEEGQGVATMPMPSVKGSGDGNGKEDEEAKLLLHVNTLCTPVVSEFSCS